MQYILTKEEFENLVPKHELINSKDQIVLIVDAFRNTDFCVQHKYGNNTYCDECPIASINLTPANGKYFKPCIHQKFSK